MKRYMIVFHSHSIGKAMSVGESDAPAEALKLAQRADQENLRDVRIVDSTTQEALGPKAFATKHRL